MNEYWALEEKFKRAYSQKHYYQALEFSLEAIKWLPQLVKDTLKEFPQWHIPLFPPLIYAICCLPVLRRRDDLRRIRALLESVPELATWLDHIDSALQQADLMDKVEVFLLENPGFIQSKLGEALGVGRIELSNLLSCAEQIGLVRRERGGRGYRLYSDKTKNKRRTLR